MAEQNLQPQDTKKNKLLFLEVGLLEIGFVILGVLIFLGVLNYFNILPVSSSIPLLSFLPSQSGSQGLNFTGGPVKVPAKPNTIAKITSPPPQDLPPFLSCPIAASICRNGKVVNQEKKGDINNFSGIGFSGFSDNQAILAALDGKIIFKSDTLDIVTIENLDRNIIVTYEMPKDSFRQGSPSAEVKKGQIIGRFADKDNTIGVFNGKFNLIFYSTSIQPKRVIDRLRVSSDGENLLNR